MKRIKSILCLCLCVLIFCSCGRKAPEYLSPVNFYYCNRTVSYNSPTALINPEVRESAGFDNDIVKFMKVYLQGPISDELNRIVPVNTVLRFAELEEHTVHLDFSKEFADLSGIELTTACVCIVKSLHEFAGVETVVFTAEGSLLDEKESFTLSMEDIVTMDTVTVED